MDEELEKKTQAITQDVVELSNQKREINQTFIEDFWKILMRFGKINVHLTMEPSYSAFAQFEEFPNEWKFKESFNFAGVNKVQLVDRTQEQGRMGDSLSVLHYSEDSTPRIRMVFEYCEGEQYYKYAGWKRIFAQFIIYDNEVSKLDMDDLHEKLGDVIKAWYESHLRRNRELLIKHLKENYERGETFTQ
ncbi:MAG: hypothetical protein ACLFPN_01390 [Methanomassiliicoccales archaeon]